MKFLDGKKTSIGAAVLLCAAFIDQVAIEIWDLGFSWLPRLSETLSWIGMLASGLGLSHKGVKLMQKVPKDDQ
jgi:hypothetical protein